MAAHELSISVMTLHDENFVLTDNVISLVSHFWREIQICLYYKFQLWMLETSMLQCSEAV